MAPKNSRPLVGELVLPFEGGSTAQTLDINWAGRVTLAHLLHEISGTDESRQATGSVTEADLQLIDPLAISNALLVGRSEQEVSSAYNGLVLPAEDYLAITTFPETPGARNRARNQEIHQAYRGWGTVSRPDASHPTVRTLDDREAAIDRRRAVAEAEIEKLDAVYRGTVPALREQAHYRADDLYNMVIDAKDIIGRMIMVAGDRMKWSDHKQAVAALALYARLLGVHGDGNRRLSSWSVYSQAAKRYARQREIMLRTSKPKTGRAVKQAGAKRVTAA